jgi:enoyl-CoA hydratase/carnithine racemase
MKLADYQNSFENIRLSRDDRGVLEVVLHTDGGELVWGESIHGQLPDALAAISGDRENRVMIITGSGDEFCARSDTSLGVLGSTAEGWDRIYAEGKRIIDNLLSIEIPVVGAVNGPAPIHAELAVLSDIVLASQTAYFQDLAHMPYGVVPGDGVHVLWPMLLGPNRGRYFLLTGEKISAEDAQDLNFVAEVLSPDELLPRARGLARQLAEKPSLLLRYSRIMLTQRLRREFLLDLGHGLALEGLAFPEVPS